MTESGQAREQDVVVILGPTATGKTSLAIRVAQAFDGEVISADSRYFYRGMDIGTAKPSHEERRGVPHHLIDIREPTEPYTLAVFLADAYRAVADCSARGRLPVVAGGTPQYLRALLEGWTVPEVAPNDELRSRLMQEKTAELFVRLQAVDAASAERIGPHNKRRMIRALEVYEKTGRPMSAQSGASPPPWRTLLLGLRQPRELLYARIDARVRAMYASGWLDEVRLLRKAGVDASLPSMSAHGYREALAVIEGRLDDDSAIRQTCALIHRYVRHQETWFRRFPDIQWIDSSQPEWEAYGIELVRAFLEDGT